MKTYNWFNGRMVYDDTMGLSRLIVQTGALEDLQKGNHPIGGTDVLPPIAIAANENEVEQAKSPDKSIAYNMNGVLQRVCRLEYHGF
nr:hypothetical protein CFP56_39789 [Quercus suber]